MSSHLLIVNSDSEQLAVAGAIKRTSNMWIGLRRDDSNKNQWIWVDGQKVTYSNWGVGEPNNINEECVVMNTSPSGKWYDDRCSERRPFICEKEGTSENLCLYESSASAKGHWTFFWVKFYLWRKGFFFSSLIFLFFVMNKIQPRHLYLQINNRSFKVHDHNTGCRKRKLWGRVWQRTNSTFESNIRSSISHFLVVVFFREV